MVDDWPFAWGRVVADLATPVTATISWPLEIDHQLIRIMLSAEVVLILRWAVKPFMTAEAFNTTSILLFNANLFRLLRLFHKRNLLGRCLAFFLMSAMEIFAKVFFA